MDNMHFYFEILGFSALTGLGLGISLSIVGLAVNGLITIFKKL